MKKKAINLEKPEINTVYRLNELLLDQAVPHEDYEKSSKRGQGNLEEITLS
jgi:hypothetical protein